MRTLRWLMRLGIVALVLGALFLGLSLFFRDFLVEMWWFQSLGYEAYFWLRLTYRYLIFAAFTLVFFLVFFLNFWIASRFLGTAPERELPAGAPARRRYLQLLSGFRSGSLKLYTPFSLLLGIFLALPLYRQWETTLLFLFAPATGAVDPVFGIDVSYYLFSLPIYLLLFNEMVLALTMLFLGLLLLYWLESRLLHQHELHLPRGARVHLSFLVVLIFLAGIWNFLLQRHQLLSTMSHTPLFAGPGLVEMRVVLPLIWVCLVLLAGTAAAMIVFIHSGHRLKYLLGCLALFALALVGRYSDYLPNLVQKYIVAPNEISRESSYITNNIQATLAAYHLDKVETREFRLEDIPWDVRNREIQASLRNIPVWDREALLDVYEELQELRTYYKFTSVDADRYTVGGVYQQVFLAPREINLDELPPGVRNWINEKLKYTHGYGAVMTPAAQGGEEPMTWFIQGIPPTSAYGFTIAQPAIYYGLENYSYAIAPNDSGEQGDLTEDSNQVSHYQGTGGVPVNSLWRKLVFAIYFGDRDIFFTTKTNPSSRMLFRRNITAMIQHLTPFLRLDRDPYIVVTEKGIFWLVDAYTVSHRYPYAAPFEENLNYIRNSVKIVVDAYNGQVDYYLAESSDPIIRAYQRMYPGLIKNLDDMPADLRSHVRYPKDLFDIQIKMYAKYHQTDPEVFYKQEDAWEFPEVQQNNRNFRFSPYYLTLNLIDKDKLDFLLLCPMSPRARNNLRALCVAGCDGSNYGRLIVYSFPKGSLVYGPSQMNAVINQDTLISEQFTLWNQQGSQVERGRMLVMPVSGSILYIQPVYLKASARLKIPQLKRIIMAKGEIVVMEPSLEEGFARLHERLQEGAERLQRRQQRFVPASPEAPPDGGP